MLKLNPSKRAKRTILKKTNLKVFLVLLAQLISTSKVYFTLDILYTPLSSVHLDMSEQLKPNPKSEELKTVKKKETDSKFIPATNREAAQWKRSNKFATNVVAVNLTENEKKTAEEDMDAYNQENTELLIWNLGLIGICFATIYVSYTKANIYCLARFC